MEIRSELTQVLVHSGAAGAQTKITIEMNPAVQNHLCLVDAAILITPVSIVSQLSDRTPKVSYLRNGVAVNGPELEDAQDSAAGREVHVILQAGAQALKSIDDDAGILPIHPIVTSLVVVTIVLVTIDLRRCSERNCQNQESRCHQRLR